MGFVSKPFETNLTPQQIAGRLFALGEIDLALVVDADEGDIRLGTGNNHWIKPLAWVVVLTSRYDNEQHDRLAAAIEVIIDTPNPADDEWNWAYKLRELTTQQWL